MKQLKKKPTLTAVPRRNSSHTLKEQLHADFRDSKTRAGILFDAVLNNTVDDRQAHNLCAAIKQEVNACIGDSNNVRAFTEADRQDIRVTALEQKATGYKGSFAKLLFAVITGREQRDITPIQKVTAA